MKVRLVVIEAEDVGAEEVAQIVQRVLGGGAPSAPAPAAPALPPAAEVPAAVLESAAEVSVATVARPPSVPTAMAPMPKTWRPTPGRKRGPKPGNAQGQFAVRPVTPEKFQCAECSEDMPAGKDRRSRCPKCGSHAWEKVPAHGGDVTANDDD